MIIVELLKMKEILISIDQKNILTFFSELWRLLRNCVIEIEKISTPTTAIDEDSSDDKLKLRLTDSSTS